MRLLLLILQVGSDNPTQPTEPLVSSFWQFVIVCAIAVLAIVVSIAIHLFQKKKKALSYEIVSNTALLTSKEELEGKLKLLYDTRPVNDVHLLIVKLMNTGNVPISPTDYENEVRFSFGESSVLSAEITKLEPKNLTIEILADGNEVRFSKSLLNRKDSVTFKVIVSDYKLKPEVDARILGVDSVKEGSDGFLFVWLLLSLVLMLGGMYIFVSLNVPDIGARPWTYYDALALAMLAGGYILGGSAILKSKKGRSLTDLARFLFKN